GSRLAGLDETQRAAVEALTKSIVAKLLHEPTVRLKDAAGTPKGDRLADALSDLFDIE
ncbi:MAG: glutamyl-tRNA reductase, partial [Acidimicrobiaceae bacterium]